MNVGNPPLRQSITKDNSLTPEWQRWISNLASEVRSIQYIEADLDPGSVDANTVERQSFTVEGLTTEDIVVVNPPALDTGLEILNWRVSARDTLQITFWNTTGSPINADEQTYKILAVRK